MKNKIGILTFHQCINYGAILQAFALLKTINNFECECDIIDYKNKKFTNKYTYRHFFKKRKITYVFYDLLTFPFWIIKKQKFDKFIKKYIKLSSKITDIKNCSNYDKYIVGSDQVWNIDTTGFDKTYFLDFVCDKKKKYSYAASFGTSEINSTYNDTYKSLLSEFNLISVREKQGAKIIKRLLNKDVAVVLDPTLLLLPIDWQKVMKISKIKHDYILVYQLAYSKSIIEFAKKLAAETGNRIITIDGNPRQPFNAKFIFAAGPSEWLGLIYNAKYVVTNSFHGLAFSVNFNKKFFLEYLGNGINVNSRLENFVERYNLNDRLIENNLKNIDLSEPNYAYINKELEIDRENSLEYLKRVLRNK